MSEVRDPVGDGELSMFANSQLIEELHIRLPSMLLVGVDFTGSEITHFCAGKVHELLGLSALMQQHIRNVTQYGASPQTFMPLMTPSEN